MMTYQPNIPNGMLPLNQDYRNLLGNFQTLDAVFGSDHVPYSNNGGTAGYHTSIHFVPLSSGNPNIPPSGYTNTPGYGQLFTATVNDGNASDQALFYDSGTGNNLTQLTMNITPVRSATGYTYMPGRVMFQWGTTTVAVAGTYTAVVFPIAFPRFCYNIQTSPILTDTSKSPNANNIYVVSGTVSLTGFTVANSSNGTVKSMYWTAVGT